jgi:hypothetical protein
VCEGEAVQREMGCCSVTHFYNGSATVSTS